MKSSYIPQVVKLGSGHICIIRIAFLITLITGLAAQLTAQVSVTISPSLDHSGNVGYAIIHRDGDRIDQHRSHVAGQRRERRKFDATVWSRRLFWELPTRPSIWRPSAVPSPASVSVTAISQADPTQVRDRDRDDPDCPRDRE